MARGERTSTLRAQLDRPPEFDFDLFERLVEDSPVKSEETKKTLAETICTLRLLLRSLRLRVQEGTATAEEHRALSGVCANIKASVLALKLTDEEREEDGGMFFNPSVRSGE